MSIVPYVFFFVYIIILNLIFGQFFFPNMHFSSTSMGLFSKKITILKLHFMFFCPIFCQKWSELTCMLYMIITLLIVHSVARVRVTGDLGDVRQVYIANM